MKPVAALVAAGANLGERRATLDAAVQAISALSFAEVTRVSSWIETAPVGGPSGQPDYLNGVLACEVRCSARELLDALLAIEARFGRDRSNEVRFGARTLDLDLLVFGEERIDEPDLVVPHPRMEERLFVLEPLAEIAPEYVLPASRVRLSDRIEALRSAVSAR